MMMYTLNVYTKISANQSKSVIGTGAIWASVVIGFLDFGGFFSILTEAFDDVTTGGT